MCIQWACITADNLVCFPLSLLLLLLLVFTAPLLHALTIEHPLPISIHRRLFIGCRWHIVHTAITSRKDFSSHWRGRPPQRDVFLVLLTLDGYHCCWDSSCEYSERKHLCHCIKAYALVNFEVVGVVGRKLVFLASLTCNYCSISSPLGVNLGSGCTSVLGSGDGSSGRC